MSYDQTISKPGRMVLLHNLIWLDMTRIISIFLVAYAHFCSVASFAHELPGLLGDETRLPLMDAERHIFLRLDVYLQQIIGTQSGAVGVVMFFMVTGYLMPLMMERYSRQHFLINRFFRIFPLLFSSTLVVGLFLFLTQGLTFDFKSYLGSWSLTYPFLGIIPVMGVLWTLVIEAIFYIIAALLGRFTVYKLFLLLLSLTASFFSLTLVEENTFLEALKKNLLFVLFILIGSSFFLGEKSKITERIFLLTFSTSICCILVYFYQQSQPSFGVYGNPSTCLLAIALCFSCIILSKLKFFKELHIRMIWLADLVYPIYLLHTAIGLSTMAILKLYVRNYAAMICGACMMTMLLAYILHIFIEKPFINIGKAVLKRNKIQKPS